MKARLDTNREWTESLAEYYEAQGKLRLIDGTGAPEDITRRILETLDATG